ncbi:porin [Vreelandella massiliensis]|uniref:porin n=1 Tax=Vreelandella massiliensis TaxID=1816686 RepID=UPI00096A893B|nr:porin [Halomonas massiliensis]
MKKTLLATAIAGAAFASGAQAATVYNQDGTQVDLYGNIQMVYGSITGSDGESTEQLGDNGTTLGIAAQHQISSDLVAYLKLEMDDFAADEMKNYDDAGDSGDQAYAGLKGNFGDVRVGSYDSIYDDLIHDSIDGAWVFGPSETSDSGETDQIRYASPSFNGFQFMIATNLKGDGEEVGRLDEEPIFDDETGEVIGFTENFTPGDPDGSDQASFVLGTKYTMGPLTLAAAFDDQGTDASGQEGELYGVSAAYALTPEFTLSGKVDIHNSDDGDTDQNLYGVKGNYAYGMGNVYTAVQNVDVDTAAGDDSYTEILMGIDYSLSSSVTFFVEGLMKDRENDAGDFVGTGLLYAF